MSDKIPECSKDGWCNAMAERLEPEANAHRKGLTVVFVCNMRTGIGRVVGVAFKSKANDPGMMLNVCPWCQQPILWSEARPAPAEIAADCHQQTL